MSTNADGENCVLCLTPFHSWGFRSGTSAATAELISAASVAFLVLVSTARIFLICRTRSSACISGSALVWEGSLM